MYVYLFIIIQIRQIHMSIIVKLAGESEYNAKDTDDIVVEWKKNLQVLVNCFYNDLK